MPGTIRSGSIVEFGVFEADLRSGELRKCGVRIKIQELPFQALRLLLYRPNEVLSREHFRHALWPDGTYVDFDRGVISTINRLRETLGDSAEHPIFIETVGRRGYRWIAPIHASESPEAIPPPVPTNPASANAIAKTDWKRSKSLFIAASVLLAAAGSYWIGPQWMRHSPKAVSSSLVASAAVPHPSANREAEELYLKGRYYWDKRTPESLNKAVDSFTQAIVHDPGYAPAYVGLADCYNLLREYTVMPASEAYPRALSAAKKAVELDPQSSQAHASLAFVHFNGMWDAISAEREFRRAIELDPSNAVAHHWYATFLECLRRYQEALDEIARAQALDPTSKSILADQGSILFNAGQIPQAVALLKEMEQDEPDFISPHRYLKVIYLITADYPKYLEESQQEALLMRNQSFLHTYRAAAKGFAAGGGNGLLQALSQQQRALYERGQLSPYLLAVTYSMMGKRQQALHYLQIAYSQHVDGVAQLEADHAFDNLADDPAFRKLLNDVGLPPLN